MKFHHIGIACENIEKAILCYESANKVLKKSDIIFDGNQNAHLAMLYCEDGSKIEFISGKQVEKLWKKDITYYHICYEVSDIFHTVKLLKKKGFLPVSKPKESILFNGRKVAFMYGVWGLIELLEQK